MDQGTLNEKDSGLRVSVRDRFIMLILSIIGAILILRPIVAFQNFTRGSFYIDNGFTGKAISQYQRAILMDPGFTDPYGWLGFAYGKLGQTGKAIQVYEKGLKVDPKDKQSYFELGLIYSRQKKYKEAATNFGKAAELDASDLVVQNLLAVTYRKMGQIEKAIAIWQNILKKDPDHAPAKSNLEKLNKGT